MHRRRIEAIVGVIALVGALLMGCVQEEGDRPRRLTQAQELCIKWGYDANDPECLRTFRQDRP